MERQATVREAHYSTYSSVEAAGPRFFKEASSTQGTWELLIETNTEKARCGHRASFDAIYGVRNAP